MTFKTIDEMLPTDEELIEDGQLDKELEAEDKAERDAEGLVESNIVGE